VRTAAEGAGGVVLLREGDTPAVGTPSEKMGGGVGYRDPHFDACRVTAENLIGEEGQVVKIISGIQTAGMGMEASLQGYARVVSRRRCKPRSARLGKPIAQHR